MEERDAKYKALKEAFVSGLSGGSISEINLVTATAPVAYILFAALQSRLRLFTPYGPLQLVLDFVLNCGAILLATTLYSSQPLLLNLLIAFPATLVCLTNPSLSKSKVAKPKIVHSRDVLNPLPKKPFLTVYRGSMMVITCIAILAVDFHVFPRRFAKVENWGTSLMDIGVGSFVFSGGLVSARTVVKQYLTPSSRSVTFAGRMTTAMRSSIPLLVLGFVRLAMVKGVDYAEHVTEYGVHWNFFFTLGLLGPFVALLQTISPTTRSPMIVYTMLCLLVGIGYQIVLKTTGLEHYVLIGDRHKYGVLGMNKEGFSSFFGYLAIFLSGMATGSFVLPRDSSSSPKQSKMLRTLLFWSAFWIASFAVTTEYWGLGINVSRRLANLPYVLWIAAFNTTQLVAFYLVERLFFGTTQAGGMNEQEEYNFSVPRVLEAFNRNGLAVFLVANLLTGAVNVSIRTLEVERITAMGILMMYTLILALFAVFLDSRNVSVKL